MITGRIVAGTAIAAVLVAIMVLQPSEVVRATTFNPQFSAPVTFSNTTPGGNPDITIPFDIPPPSALGGAVNFSDPALVTASDSQIPNGAYIGSISTLATLGLANEGCMTDTPVDFDLVEANTDTTALTMTPNVTLTSAISDSATSFLYTSTGDPIGPSDPNPEAITWAEIEIDSEQMLVTSINEATNNYGAVVRGWNGTTPAPHDAGAQVRKVNVIFAAGSSSNLQGNMSEDDGDLDNNGTAEFPQFAGNGVADAADSMPSAVRDSLDPNGDPDDGGAVSQHARYFGTSVVAGILIIPINVAILAPGSLSVFPNRGWMTATWGAPSLIILGDPDAPPSNSGISDFCNLSSASMIFGRSHDNACTAAVPPPECSSTFAGFNMRNAVDGGCPGNSMPNECGFNRATNPATTKTLKARVFAASERDYDNDGHPNSLDTCSYTPNPTWNPRAFNALSGGDADGDGLPTVCDPNDGAFNTDQDGDGWSNRVDNCPNTFNPSGLGPNTGQSDQDLPRGMPVGDSGSHADGIGPECDIASNSCAGCSTLTPTGPNGHYHATVIVSHVCIGLPGADSDGDGVCNLQEPPAVECAGGVNDTDCDNDGVGDRLDNCIGGSNPPPAGFAQTQRDVTADGFSDTGDIGLVTNAFGAEGGDPGNDGIGDSGVVGYQGRLDINYDSFIDTGDIGLITGVFGKAC